MNVFLCAALLSPALLNQQPSATNKSKANFGQYSATVPAGWRVGGRRGSGLELFSPDAKDRSDMALVLGASQLRGRNMEDVVKQVVRSQVGSGKVANWQEGQSRKINGFDFRYDVVKITRNQGILMLAVGVWNFRGEFVVSTATSDNESLFARQSKVVEQIFRSIQPTAGRRGR